MILNSNLSSFGKNKADESGIRIDDFYNGTINITLKNGATIKSGVGSGLYFNNCQGTIININIDKIESMILEYDKEIKKSISDKNIENVQLNFGYLNRYSFYDFKNVSVPINEDIFTFIENKQCLRLYLFFIYYTYKLENNIKWFKLSQRDIGIILDLNEVKVREYINILINNNLIERRRIDYKKNFYYEYRIIPYEEFMQIKNDNFICDS